MHDIDLKKISKLLTEKLSQKVNIVKIEPVGDGCHSVGYKLISDNGENFFVKKVKTDALGIELPEKKIYSYLMSDGMHRRADSGYRPVGIYIDNGIESFIMPEITKGAKIYHIQECIPEFSDQGNNYRKILESKANKDKVDQGDIEEINKITDLIIKVHSQKYGSKDNDYLKKIYNDGLRSVINNPELTLSILQSLPRDYDILPIHMHKEYLGHMLDIIYKWEGRSDRLCALHGDFWGNNLFFINNKPFLIDFSRIPWGDPGIDIGWWMFEYMWLYYKTGNNYYQKLGEEFLKIYEQKTKDSEIREAICIVAGLLGIVHITPLFYPDLDIDKGRKFLNNIWNILRNKKFGW